MNEPSPGAGAPRRYLLWAAAAFGLGLAAGRFLAPAPEAILLAAAVLAALAAAAFFAGFRRALALAALALAALAGALNYTSRAADRPAGEAGALLGIAPGAPALAVLTGRVEDLTPSPASSGGGWQMLLAVESVGTGDARRAACGRVRLSLRADDGGGQQRPEVPRPGERVTLPALLGTPDHSRTPGAMDYPGYLAARGIWTTGKSEAGLCRREPATDSSVRGFLARARERAAEIIRSRLPEREGALLNTLLIGWRGDMEPEDALAFTRTGTGHLLAVSGIHVMLLVGTVWWLLRMLRFPPRLLAAALVLFAAAYAELAGARAPVLRAALMAALLLGGMSLGRQSDGLTSLAAAFLAILAIWPREIFEAGFQMSFAAVAFIMTVVPALEGAWRAHRKLHMEDLAVERREVWRAKIAGWLRLSVFSSIAATAGTLPLTVSCFGLITPWAAVVNLLAIPAASLVLALGLALLVIGLICPPLAPLPAALAWGALRLLEIIVNAAERLPGCSPIADQPPAWLLAAFYGAAALLLLPGDRLGRWRSRAALAAVGLAVAVSVAGRFPAKPPPGPRVTLLGLRRGQAAVYQDASGRSAVVWAGGSGRELADFLRAERMGAADCALVTSDRPWAFSGAGYLERARRTRGFALPPGELFDAETGEPLRLTAETRHLAPGWRRRLGQSRLEALGAEPLVRRDGSRRARPLMILATAGCPGGALFADLTGYSGPSVRAAAAEFAARGLRTDVLAVGYTWKAPPGSAELLRRSGARVALVSLSEYEARESAGRELIGLLRRGGLTVFSTAELGSVRATRTADRLVLEHYAEGRWRALMSLPAEPSAAAAGTADKAPSGPPPTAGAAGR